jgi:1,4-dihydroxy-2-naphthoyl-CoA hydrolase
MPFTYTRTVRFGDTDAAGVVYFANVLVMCHEACEESLAASGINLKAFFSNPSVTIPIVHASVDFLRPMFCGDQLLIHLITKKRSGNEFEIAYQILATADKVVAKAITKHVCIDPISRTRKEMPAEIIQWLHQWGES